MLVNQSLFIFLALSLLAINNVDAAATANNTMSVGDGTTVTTNSTTTIFLGTEYNPNKCVLQLDSLKCKSNKDCGEVNGYNLECEKLGKQDGVEKNQCKCSMNQTDLCQNSTAPAKSGVPQFGDCSDKKECVDSFGHVASVENLQLRICAEKLHCVKEINTTSFVPAEICHTCRSCIAQNNAANTTLTDLRRFDCRPICPPEILDSLAKRNKHKVGIADGFNSSSESGQGSNSADSKEKLSSASGSGGGVDKKKDSKSGTVGKPFSLATLATAIVVVGSLLIWEN